MNKSPKTPSQMVEYIAQVKRDQEATWKRLSEADEQLQALTLWTVPDLVDALAHGRVHIAPGHDPALTAPTSAREALDLAWELAHPVKKGQAIPMDTEYLQTMSDGAYLHDFIGTSNFTASSRDETLLRTLNPLPEPLPDWLDAPAVTADCECSPGGQTVYVSHGGIGWTCASCDTPYAPEDLENVTPLYPKEQGAIPAEIPDTPLRSRAYLFHYGKPWSSSLGGDPA